MRRTNDPLIEDVPFAHLMDLTVADLLRDRYPEVRFRAGFREHPYLEAVTVADLFASSFSLDSFLADCRNLPQCGDVQLNRLRRLLEDLAGKAVPKPAASDRPQGRSGNSRTEASVSTVLDVHSPGLPVQGRFYPDFVSSWEAVYKRVWRLAYFDRFIYVPSSLPEFVKTPEILRAEHGPDADLGDYLSGIKKLRISLPSVQGGAGLILIDESALSAIFDREGCYRDITKQALDLQKHELLEMLKLLPSSIDFRVCDLRATGPASCAIVGDLVTCSIVGGYFVTEDKEFREALARRCLDAARSARSLKDFLDR
jgi:hypothetical protein